MPIRINLLAEAQAQEEMRRKDPVKRAVYAAVVLLLLMLAWSSSLQLKAMLANGELGRVEGQIATRSKEFQTVLDQQRQLRDAELKLAALQKLGTNRLLQGTMLNALQQSIVDEVQLVRMRCEQTYFATAAVAAKTNGATITPGKPATIAERVQFVLDARDTGPLPGDQVNVYRQAISTSPYFQGWMGTTNEVRLATLSAPQKTAEGRSFVTFTLECRYPEVIR
jgi:hypothetical protein